MRVGEITTQQNSSYFAWQCSSLWAAQVKTLTTTWGAVTKMLRASSTSPHGVKVRSTGTSNVTTESSSLKEDKIKRYSSTIISIVSQSQGSVDLFHKTLLGQVGTVQSWLEKSQDSHSFQYCLGSWGTQFSYPTDDMTYIQMAISWNTTLPVVWWNSTTPTTTKTSFVMISASNLWCCGITCSKPNSEPSWNRQQCDITVS